MKFLDSEKKENIRRYTCGDIKKENLQTQLNDTMNL